METKIDWFLFPQDSYLTNVLSWLGQPYPVDIAERLARAVQKQQPGTCLLAIQCLERPDLQTFSHPGGRVTQITVQFSLRMLVVDARGRPAWLKAAVELDGRHLDHPQQQTSSVEYRVLESRQLAPDGKILADRLKTGLWLERRQVMVPWGASRERLLELGGRPIEGDLDPPVISLQDDSVLGGIAGQVHAELCPGPQRLCAANIFPSGVPEGSAPADELFAEWLRLTEHFGPAFESQPGKRYYWKLGPVSIYLCARGENAGERLTPRHIRIEQFQNR